MCGIIGVTRRPSDRLAPSSAEILALVERAPGLLADRSVSDLASRVVIAADHIATADTLLRGVPGVEALLADRSLGPALEALLAEIASHGRDHRGGPRPRCGPPVARPRSGQRRARPAEGRGLGRRSGTACAPLGRSPTSPVPSPVGPPSPGYTSIQVALSALDRLEVRGRDSAGIHLLVRDHDLDLESPAHRRAARRPARATRCSRPHRSVPRTSALSFVYKAAAEIGELGDNTRALRADIHRDTLLQEALSGERRPGRRARPHPLGERRHHLPAQRAPAERGGDRPGRRPVRRRRAQRRRRQLRRPEDERGAAHRAGDHHRREGHPHARVAAAGQRATRSTTRSGARSPGSTARSPSRPARPTRPPTCCSPSGAAARRSTSAWPTG